jgi:hypothetical protein
MNTLHAKWLEAKQALDLWKKEEAELRMLICEDLLKGKPYGVHRTDFLDHRMIATRVANYSLDQPATAELFDSGALTAEEEDLIKVKYELKVGPYKKASIDTSTIDKLITLKDGMPQLQLVYLSTVK